MTSYSTEGFTFEGWPKIPRFGKSADLLITEKVDGTNGGIHISETGQVAAQSRTRLLDPANGVDNFGFGRWVLENAEALAQQLGPGLHYGEWYGSGIQRGYGLSTKRFLLFSRAHSGYYAEKLWNPEYPEEKVQAMESLGLQPVPVLYSGPWTAEAIGRATYWLLTLGSLAAVGFTNPEGLVLTHRPSGVSRKIIFDSEEPKSAKPGHVLDADGNHLQEVASAS